jgi:hypothetical protein
MTRVFLLFFMQSTMLFAMMEPSTKSRSCRHRRYFSGPSSSSGCSSLITQSLSATLASRIRIEIHHIPYVNSQKTTGNGEHFIARSFIIQTLH